MSQDSQRSKKVSIGLRSKSGRAIAAVVQDVGGTPAVVRRDVLALVDPRRPATRQPYHELMDLPWDEAEERVRETAVAIQRAATRGIEELARQVRAAGCKLCGVGIVGGSDIDPGRIANNHIRAHAAEGRLFRQVLEAAAGACNLFKRAFAEKGFEKRAAGELGLTEERLRKVLKEAGRTAGRPWGSDEKMATAAGWIVLAVQGKG